MSNAKAKQPANKKTGLLIKLFWAVLLGALLYGSYYVGVRSGHQQVQEDQAQIESLNQTKLELEDQLKMAREQVVFAQRQVQIKDEAYKQFNLTYAGLERENSYLESRLDFYRSIVSPPDGLAGPAIDSLEFRQQGEDVVFDLILIQALKHKHQVIGNLHLELYQTYDLVAKWPATNAKVVNFQYFEQVSGVFEDITLNEDTRIKVELQVPEQEPILAWYPEPPPPITAAEKPVDE